MVSLEASYESENLKQPESETDPFTVQRYRQFARHAGPHPARVLDVGCGTGRGGVEFKRVHPSARLYGLDIVKDRLAQLPSAYDDSLLGLAVDIPMDSGSVDTVLAGEFLEHLRPHDVDAALCEFQRLLSMGGKLLLTTPHPGYVKLVVKGGTVLTPGHLTQHHPRILKSRILAHGFRSVSLRGSGQVSGYLGEHLRPLRLYGSYLVVATKR